MSIIFEKRDSGIIAHVEVNGHTVSIMYDPESSPLRPFEKTEDLERLAMQKEKELGLLEPYIEEPVAESEPSPESRSWRPDLFWRRFTIDEQAQLLIDAKEDPMIELFKMNLSMTPVVLSDDPITIKGMDYLVKTGRLGENRKNEILGGN